MHTFQIKKTLDVYLFMPFHTTKMSVVTLKCIRTVLTIMFLFVTFKSKNLPISITLLGHVYLSLSSCIASFDAQKKNPFKWGMQIIPFVIASCALQHINIVECVTVLTLTLPLLQSVAALDLKTSTINLSVSCILVTVELLMVYAKGNTRFKSVKTVHATALVVFALSVAVTLFPESYTMVAMNPLFQYIQGVGCLAMWQTREKTSLLLPRQHAIGGYFTLSVAYIALYWTMRISNLSGWAVLHIGNSFKKYVPGTDLFLGLTHPFVLSASVHGIPEESNPNLLLRSIVTTLVYLDSVTIALICVGPHFTDASWIVLKGATGVDAKWVKMFALCSGIFFVVLTTKLHNALVQVVWTRWKRTTTLYTQNIPGNNANDTQVLSEDCFQLTEIEEEEVDDKECENKQEQK